MLERNAVPDEIVEELFIRTLCRRPTSNEREAIRELIGEDIKDRAIYEDIFWSLLNSTEFSFNH